MLLDEPAVLIQYQLQMVQNIIRHLAARGIGVLITDHNARNLGICNRGYIVNVDESLQRVSCDPAHKHRCSPSLSGEQFK